MSFVTKHAGKLCFGVTAALCLCAVLVHLDNPEPASFKTLNDDTRRLRELLAAKAVSPDYRYGERAYAERYPVRQVRDTLAGDVTPWIIYPRPSKPTIDPASIPTAINVVEDTAVLPPVTQVRTLAERACIRIELQLPATRYLQNLRAELFRATGTDTMDTVHPFASIDLETVQAKDGWYSFADTHVEPKCRYFYRVRLVCALNHPVRVKKDDAGNVLSEFRILPPREAVLISAPNRELSVFAGPLSAIISDVSPSNFEIRFAGTTGRVPLAGASDTLALDYSGRFLVRVWIPEIQAWKEQTLDLRPGDRLAGRVLYKPAQNADPKAYAFDTGKVFEQIRREEISRTATVQSQVLNDDQSPELDPATHQPRTVARTVKTTGIPTDIAVLKDSETGQSEEMTRR